jgi:hypothetical protein
MCGAASVLYGEDGDILALALAGAVALFGWWLALKGGEVSVLGDIGRGVRAFVTLGIILSLAAFASGMLAERVSAYKPLHEDWTGWIAYGVLVFGIALYTVGRWRTWHASVRWFFGAVTRWPLFMFVLVQILNRIGATQLDGAVQIVFFAGVAACLGLSAYAGRSLWRRTPKTPASATRVTALYSLFQLTLLADPRHSIAA